MDGTPCSSETYDTSPAPLREDPLTLPPIFSDGLLDQLAKKVVDLVWDKFSAQGEVFLAKLFEKLLDQLFTKLLGTPTASSLTADQIDKLRQRLQSAPSAKV